MVSLGNPPTWSTRQPFFERKLFRNSAKVLNWPSLQKKNHNTSCQYAFFPPATFVRSTRRSKRPSLLSTWHQGDIAKCRRGWNMGGTSSLEPASHQACAKKCVTSAIKRNSKNKFEHASIKLWLKVDSYHRCFCFLAWPVTADTTSPRSLDIRCVSSRASSRRVFVSFPRHGCLQLAVHPDFLSASILVSANNPLTRRSDNNRGVRKNIHQKKSNLKDLKKRRASKQQWQEKSSAKHLQPLSQPILRSTGSAPADVARAKGKRAARLWGQKMSAVVHLKLDCLVALWRSKRASISSNSENGSPRRKLKSQLLMRDT